MKFTIGYIEHDLDVFNKHLGPSLENLRGDFDIVTTSDKNKPAKNYNEIVKRSENDYVILLHQDISFSPDLLERIELTINTINNHGVEFSSLGLVGPLNSEKHAVEWSSSENIHRFETVDCCFLLVKKSTDLLFDEVTFDDYHLYVEDYCASARKKTGHHCYSIGVNGAEGKFAPIDIHNTPNMIHHSATLTKRGSCWGKYHEYKQRLIAKHGNIKTT